MARNLTLILFLSLSHYVFSQKEFCIWHFGDSTGIDFNSGKAVALKEQANMRSLGSCASISDASGKFLFSVTWNDIWSDELGKKKKMWNSDDINARSVAQGNVIIPVIGSNTEYYVFKESMHYSIIDMSMNSGTGGVVASRKNTSVSSVTFDHGITSVRHSNGIDYWVIVRKNYSDSVYAFQVTSSGVKTTPVISRIGYTMLWFTQRAIKVSPDGKKIAFSTTNGFSWNVRPDTTVIADFNPATGQVSNPWTFPGGGSGIEFSPSSNYVYMDVKDQSLNNTGFSYIVQYHAKATSRSAFIASRTVLYTKSASIFGLFCLQLAPDGKIYISQNDKRYLHVIHAPDSSGTNCRYQADGFYLGRKCFQGLPLSVSSFILKKRAGVIRHCLYDSAKFIIPQISGIDSVRWNFDDPSSGAANVSTSITGAYHIYKKTGNYAAVLTRYYKTYTDTVIIRFQVRDTRMSLGRDTSFCNTFAFRLKPDRQYNYVSYSWSTGSKADFLPVSAKGTYRVTVEDSAGCIHRDTIVVHNPRIAASAYITDTMQCFSSNVFTMADVSTFTDDFRKQVTWHFSDGDTITGFVVRKTFKDTGRFSIRIHVNSQANCKDSIKEFVRVLPGARPQFDINNDSQCLRNHAFSFTNRSASEDTIIGYAWDMGDQTFSSDKDIPLKTYTLDSSYKVSLVTTNGNGCTDTIVKVVNVYPDPVASFKISKDRQCFRGNAFSFSNTSTLKSGSMKSYWDLGNGIQQGTTHVNDYSYFSEDTFKVTLVTESGQSCRDTVSHPVVTFAQPMAGIAIPNDSQCWQHHDFKMVNQTILKYGTMRHAWDFGDGSTDTVFQPAGKKYANTSAAYTIRYRVYTEHGCSDSTTRRIVLLERPVADFSVNDSVQCFRDHVFDFTSHTTFSAMHSLAYYWNYGNGDTSTGIKAKTIRYGNAQYYPVTLVAYSYLSNCYDTISRQVLAAPQAVPDFTADRDSQCLRFNNFNLTNTSTVAFGNMNYHWDFRDGSFSLLDHPVKHYTSGSRYLVRLLITTDRQCKDSIEKPLTLVPHPKASFSINDSGQCLNKHSFILFNTSSLAYGMFTSKWLFDDNTSDTNRDVAAKTFSTGGRHSITLTLNSDYGCTDTTSSDIHLEKPLNSFITPQTNDSQCQKGNMFGFRSGSRDKQISFISRNWRFGDGRTGSGDPVSNRYRDSGSYTVTLETISLNGCLDTAYFKVVVHPHPVSGFDVNSPCFPEAAVFRDTSGGNIIAYHWEFDDLSTSSMQHPVKFYSRPGTYGVKLVTTSEFGCKDTVSRINAVVVRKRPKASFDFTFLPSREAGLSSLQMQNKSSAGAISNAWDFGNGATSSETDPVADYWDTASRKIMLVVTNQEGCTDSFSRFTGKIIPDFYFFAPTAFSPDANNLNEGFRPVALPYVHKFEMEIFNRWGERVFETSDITKGWDGTFYGDPCQEGVYLCRMYVVPLRGHVQHREFTITLLR